MNFKTLGVSQALTDKLKKIRIITPTPIQEQVIPIIMSGKDVIAQSQTGTGKTLAFVLPTMDMIDTNKGGVQSLIITPTRELAIQITQEVQKLASVKGINILAAYGGQDVEKQIHKLKGDIHMVIATPGRLLDHLRRKTINFGQLKFLILDEADQMLHMGFLNEVEEIIAQTPKRRQTMLFSATMPDAITRLASRYMQTPKKIEIQSNKVTLEEIEQVIIETTDRKKQEELFNYFKENNPFLAIIFCRTKRRASKLNELLLEQGFNSDELHGDLSQAKRERVMKRFRNVEIQYLVATDIAARGLDVDGVTHVVNYDVPEDTESYIHRIGRTGRAGHTGVALTFVTPRDKEKLITIEKGIKMTIKKQKKDIEAKNSPKSPRGSRGGRKQEKTSREENERGNKKFSNNKQRNSESNNRGTRGKGDFKSKGTGKFGNKSRSRSKGRQK
ncbi:DEAD/DEAH box helicase [Serpentinicella sp. ANB-PHB4]|uniref:DEAD/DEAH box helicase n=1 Tax=Serpentinicella sp. ANB-PHB4 TaxID=3074076 RepID=UPI00285DE20E|nr:DEAD/DEAH box helicase [Serpentinicella sp. ANB-PHB4]MDR5658946.1 DEAD/DEAH box helicase [Serpentinicella sp. ANB-PHB4]